MLYVIMGRQGSGKTALKNELVNNYGVIPIVTTTTRKPRSGEIDGVDYHFTDKDTFNKMINEDKILEFIELNGNMYGTSIQALSVVNKNPGKDYVIVLDPEGMSKIIAVADVMDFVLCPIEVYASTDTRIKRMIEGRGDDFDVDSCNAREKEEDERFSTKHLKDLGLLFSSNRNESAYERISSENCSIEAMASIALNYANIRSTLGETLARCKADANANIHLLDV